MHRTAADIDTRFAFTITIEIPRGSTNDPLNAEHGILVVHAIPVSARA